MRSLADVDRDLEALGVPPARLAEARSRAARARPESLAAVDAELAALSAGTAPVARSRPEPAVASPGPDPRWASAFVESDPPPPPAASEASVPAVADAEADGGRGSGLIEVSDEVLRGAELPAVLALDDGEAPSTNDDIAGALSALALDLDSGETPIEMAPEPIVSREQEVPREASVAAGFESGLDDPNADFAALLGEADPLREAEPAPAASELAELEEEHTVMFSAADADRFSRPPPPDETVGDDYELDIEEVVLDDAELLDASEPEPARAPRTQPPPPPGRTQPPEPPKSVRPSEAPRGFLGKLLQRKP